MVAPDEQRAALTRVTSAHPPAATLTPVSPAAPWVTTERRPGARPKVLCVLPIHVTPIQVPQVQVPPVQALQIAATLASRRLPPCPQTLEDHSRGRGGHRRGGSGRRGRRVSWLIDRPERAERPCAGPASRR